MPAYLIVHTERRGDDTLIEDDNLTVEFTNGWALFEDRDLTQSNRVVLAVPAAQVARIQRVDEEQEPAPHDQSPR